MKIIIQRKSNNNVLTYENVLNVEAVLHDDPGSYMTITHVRKNGRTCETSIAYTDIEELEMIIGS